MQQFLHSLQLRYSMYFNKKNKRVGPLFQGRYKAVMIENDSYLLHLSRYIHLNPSEYTEDNEMNDSIPEKVNGRKMGVKFAVWLEKDPEVRFKIMNWENELFWERNFYPDIYTVANDLYKKGLIEAGDYIINIDW